MSYSKRLLLGNTVYS